MPDVTIHLFIHLFVFDIPLMLFRVEFEFNPTDFRVTCYAFWIHFRLYLA